MRDIHRVVISGATSSIGTALIDECIGQGIEVLALVNKGSSKISLIPSSELITIIECPLDEYSSLMNEEGAIRADTGPKYDAFFHLAWTSTSGDGARDQIDNQITNIRYSVDAVDLAVRLGCRVFVGAGSQAEYGRTDEILTEQKQCYPETAYGIAKLCAGQMTRLKCRQLGIDHIWPRILSGYGPNCQPHTIVDYTIRELLARRSPSLTECRQIWDFIYTEDIARALLLLSGKGRDQEIYVIGAGQSRVLKEYIEIIHGIINPDIPILYGQIEYGENSVMHLACDISKLREDTGFSPQTSFEEGVKKTIEWIQLD